MKICEICFKEIKGNYYTITIRYWLMPDDYTTCKINFMVCERCANRDTSMYRHLFDKLDEKKIKLDKEYQKVI